MHKYIFLCGLISTLHFSQSSVEDQVKELIEKIRNAIPEPINVPEMNISVPENEYISGFLDWNSCYVTGLKAFDLKVDFLCGKIPPNINLHLEKLNIITDYTMNMPLLNMQWLALFGLGNVHLSLSDLSVNASIFCDLENPLCKLKINLSDAQLGITGFLNDADYSRELSEDLSKSIPSIVNSDEFSSLVETIINDIVANIFMKKNDATVAVPAIDDGAERGQFVVDLLNALRIWEEESFEYANTQET